MGMEPLNAPPTGSKFFSFKRVYFFSSLLFFILLVPIDNPDDYLFTSPLSILLLLSFSATLAVFFWIQINAFYFLNSCCDNISSFFLHRIIRLSVLYKRYMFTIITPNPHINNTHHRLRFIVQCWKLYEFWCWSSTSTEFM